MYYPRFLAGDHSHVLMLDHSFIIFKVLIQTYTFQYKLTSYKTDHLGYAFIDVAKGLDGSMNRWFARVLGLKEADIEAAELR